MAEKGRYLAQCHCVMAHRASLCRQLTDVLQRNDIYTWTKIGQQRSVWDTKTLEGIAACLSNTALGLHNLALSSYSRIRLAPDSDMSSCVAAEIFSPSAYTLVACLSFYDKAESTSALS